MHAVQLDTTHLPQRLNVLLVDDDPADRLLAEEAFSEYAGVVTVHTSPDGPAALAALHDPQRPLPDVVILDLNMPEMNGFEVIAAIRSAARTRHLPVVILSTSDRSQDVARAYDLLASSYMVKSRDFPGFVKQIEHFVHFWYDCRFAR